MSFIIDRFEDILAVVILENGDTYNMPKALLPQGAKEGDVISLCIDKEKTDIKKCEAKELLNSLFCETE